MKSLTRAETARYLAQRDCFVIVTHRRPDGDTLGSAAVLCRGLRQLGKTAHVLYNPEITAKYTHLLEGLTVPAIAQDRTVVSVDVAAEELLPKGFAGQIDLRIDHHRSAGAFAEYGLVDPTAGACGQIIYDVLCEMGAKLDVPMANALYTAISTDTGCFRYQNTQSHTFEVAAACAKVSTDLKDINIALFETNSLARLKLQGWLIDHAQFLQGGQVVICALPLEIEKQLGVTEDDMENISGFPRSISGVKIAATLRQNPDGTVKLSVRAIPDYDANAICQTFGGGGHRGAAGATLHMPLEDAAKAVIAAMPEVLS